MMLLFDKDGVCAIMKMYDNVGISGGQKKRVSTAMEMMKEAALFFLDGELSYGQQNIT